MEHTDESDRELLLRAEVIRSYMLRHPGLLDPFDALVGIVWPTPEFAARFHEPRRKPSNGICAGCGCDFDIKTDNCPTCWDRHFRRAKRALAPICVGCGCEFDAHTPDCRVCYERHKSRRLRKQNGVEPVSRRCARCDIGIIEGDYTPGCRTCKDRRYRDRVRNTPRKRSAA